MNPKLSVILPCYNVPNLVDNLIEVIEVVKDITDRYEIILVNDGSIEFPYVTQNDYVKVITHPKNLGKGESLIDGFKKARGEIICFIDADLQIPATTLKSYYQIMKGNRNPDILVGSKRHHNSKVNYPFIRRVYSFGIQIINKFIFGFTVFDTQCGVKMMKKNVVGNILPFLKTEDFAIDIEILFLCQLKGYKIIEAPVYIKESFSSTVSIWSVVNFLSSIIRIWCRYKFKNYERSQLLKSNNGQRFFKLQKGGKKKWKQKIIK